MPTTHDPAPEWLMGLPWPPSVNHYWRRGTNGAMYISSEGRAYRHAMCVLLAGHEPLTCRVQVVVRAHPPDRRRRDLDNVLKALLDALQHGGVYEDDEQIDFLSIQRGPVRKGGAVDVLVGPFDMSEEGV